MIPPYLSTHDEGVVIHIRVVPKASRSKIAGQHGDELKIMVKAPPSEGQANKELLRFLAKSLGVSNSRIQLLSGETSRSKRVLIRSIPIEEMHTLLECEM